MPEKSYNPRVSLDPSIHYKTQSAAYDKLLVGKPLTDARIEYYAALRRGEQPEDQKKKVKSDAALRRKQNAKRITKDLLESLGL